jgi:hypothetical protein
LGLGKERPSKSDFDAKKQPLNDSRNDIVFFMRKQPTYNPQMRAEKT